MKFRYKKYSLTTLRPVIPIKIFANDQQLTYEVLVDSGADTSIFHTKVAEILGIKIRSGKESRVSGVTGKQELIYLHFLSVAVGDQFFKLEVGFLDRIGAQGYGIVGQKGFFENFIVKFDLLKAEIELKPR